MQRIEFTEYFQERLPDEVVDRCENMGLPLPKRTSSYRRIKPLFRTLEYPLEIPEQKEHCQVLFKNGDTITVLGSYDSIVSLFEMYDMLSIQPDESEE